MHPLRERQSTRALFIGVWGMGAGSFFALVAMAPQVSATVGATALRRMESLTEIAAAEGVNALVVERVAPRGKAGTSTPLENYTGFPFGVSGDDLAAKAMRRRNDSGLSHGCDDLESIDSLDNRVDSSWPVFTPKRPACGPKSERGGAIEVISSEDSPR